MRQDLTGSETSPEQQFDQSLHDKVLVYRYWYGRDSSEIDLGFGAYRLFLFIVPVVIILSFLGAIIFSLLDMGMLSLLFSISGMLFSLAIFWRGFKYYGWYEVDKQGKPVQFIGHTPPDTIMGRHGTRRAKFLEYVKEKEGL
jgi:hypothetical protein